MVCSAIFKIQLLGEGTIFLVTKGNEDYSFFLKTMFTRSLLQAFNNYLKNYSTHTMEPNL
jgi:hypothetical protein